MLDLLILKSVQFVVIIGNLEATALMADFLSNVIARKYLNAALSEDHQLAL